jgi:hypothetical protein
MCGGISGSEMSWVPGRMSEVRMVAAVTPVRPDSGKMAVKVTNHYGDEVLRVFGV